jgi:hypothetical protein
MGASEVGVLGGGERNRLLVAAVRLLHTALPYVPEKPRLDYQADTCSARVQRGLSIEQVAQTPHSARLPIPEDEAFDELPAPVCARIPPSANYLKIDANPLSNS